MKNVLEVPVAGLAIFLTIDVKFYIVLIIMIILVMLSAFFSMSETAFSSANDVKIRVAIEDRKHGAKKALQLYDSFDKTLITLLIGNNLVNVALSTLAVLWFGYLIQNQDWVSLISTFSVTVILLIFGEIVPKSFAKENAEKLALKLSGPMYFVIKLL